MSQDVQWFDDKTTCIEMKTAHEEIPPDGSFSSVEYECVPVNGAEA
tara:strand:- start:325 stop:462 length:138 start_codon:yes stop_codon:yes gene_type:complete